MSDKLDRIVEAPQEGCNLQGIVDRIRVIRAEKRPVIEEKLTKLDMILAALRDTRCKAQTVAVRYPELESALKKVSFSDIETGIVKAQTACKKALARLSRDSVNIGVAGRARQGKSQILQMLTGLDNRQIPTGDGGFCTASRSVVRNGKGKSAIIHYLTATKLLEDKVYPSYGPVGENNVFALGFSLDSRPASVEEFLTMELPSVPSTASVEASGNWKKVQQLQYDLRNRRELVAKLNASPEPLASFDDVRNYLVKDGGETAYQVVDYVEIVTPFNSGLPDGTTVIDLPGLEDPTPGIRETMLKSVSEDADVVLLLRMPRNTGDDWDGADARALNMLKSVYPDPNDNISPKDWVLLVINLDIRHKSNNEKNVKEMSAKTPDGFESVICNCGSPDDVSEKLVSRMDVLAQQVGRIDDLRIRQAELAFRKALGEVGTMYIDLQNASSDIVAQESGFDFERHLLAFMAQLRDPFREDVLPEFCERVEEVLIRHFNAAKQKFDGLYQQNEGVDVFPAEFPAFSKKRLVDEFGAAEGPSGPVEKAVRNQREALLKLLREQLGECCSELVGCYFDCVVDVGFASNPALSRIGETTAESSIDRLKSFLEALRRSGTFTSLEDAVNGLLRFNLAFESVILPVIYSMDDLDDFNPEHQIDADSDTSEFAQVKNYIANELHDSGKRAEALYNWLRQKSEIILYGITTGSSSSPISQISKHIANTMRANYDAFVFRFIWGDATTSEWRRFADRNKAVFWKEEFDAASANSQLAKEWKVALEALRGALV